MVWRIGTIYSFQEFKEVCEQIINPLYLIRIVKNSYQGLFSLFCKKETSLHFYLGYRILFNFGYVLAMRRTNENEFNSFKYVLKKRFFQLLVFLVIILGFLMNYNYIFFPQIRVTI